ncbi:MAG: septation regulator SpoVG [Ruminococcaceae bacterium]|nr:septation regulator SpoVG [Oscillospiraceae bacterium]
MTVSDVRIRRTVQDGRLRAVVSITLDNCIAVHDIRLVQGDDRLFVAMPSRRDDEGRYRDIIHPINSDIRNQIEDRIIEAYQSLEAAADI